MAFAFLSRLSLIALIIALPLSATGQSSSTGNVTLGSSIVANSASSTWKSPSGEFAFGFRQVAPGGYLVAIWFDKMPERTIIWSANRDNLAQQGSTIQLFSDGRFELNDPIGRRIWAANLDPTSAGVAYAAMLDSGDFVLTTNSSAVLWQSFDEPTDTLLPTQILNEETSLIASFSETNYSRGRFQFRMQADGNLVLYTRNFPMGDIISAYWSTQTFGNDGSRLIFNQSGYIYLTARNGTILNTLSSNVVSTSLFYQRLTLDFDGVLRHYVYPKSANSAGGRAVAWSVNEFWPSNLCVRIRQSTGGGACGFNSLCSLGVDQRPNCSCPVGYSPLDPNDRMSDCKQDFVQQSCSQDSQSETDLFSFNDMPNTNWPDSDYAYFRGVSEDYCRQACLDDCFCAVAVYASGDCWKKKIPLSNGAIDSSIGTKALVKIRKNNTAVNPSGSNNSRKSSNRSALIVTGSVLLGSSVFLNLLLLSSVLFFIFRYRGRKPKTVQVYTVPTGAVSMRSFSFDELNEATNGFNEEIGSGACSTVYKGVLKDENGTFVAVKKLNKIAGEAEQEFKAEVSSISRTNHKNLVQLLGYCDEGQNRLLVYEYMPNGSLANFLFENPTKPNWYRRLQIAFATARGLCYLHEECSTQIIHCDIKPQNVLLDGSHTAKISDFGLAKLLRADQTRTTTGIRGTRGYVAPEWFRSMPITVKVDVYSFGILLLEILCCRRNFDMSVEDESQVVLTDWAYDCYKEGALRDLVVADDEVAAVDDMKRFERLVMVAIWCIQEDPGLRPHMRKVVHMLEGSVEVTAPPDPASFVS